MSWSMSVQCKNQKNNEDRIIVNATPTSDSRTRNMTSTAYGQW